MNMTEFEQFNKIKGLHFFERETIDFFNSIIETDFIDDDGHFITSEQFDNDSPRLYTIRKANFETGSVDTIDNFQAYETKEEAIDYLILKQGRKKI